jgi:hypothetical protein
MTRFGASARNSIDPALGRHREHSIPNLTTRMRSESMRSAGPLRGFVPFR